MIKFIFQTMVIVFLHNCFAGEKFSEFWVDYDDISKISLGTNQEGVISALGEPLMILADTDDNDNTIYLYYNYRIKSYLIDNNKRVAANKRSLNNERTTLIKFTFFDDALVSWEEDKLTLGMSNNKQKNDSSIFFHYFSLLLNLVLLIKIL